MATNNIDNEQPWYRGISRYQWLVLFIACLGWVFDVFEGQIFVASMREAMPSLVPPGTDQGVIAQYNNFALGAFLAGGAVGGVLFGMLSDRIGRKRTLSLTILFYSFFTFISAFSQEWWHLAGLRFLVALGLGGEWAVAGALVAEVFPNRARTYVGGIFHASSVFGSYLAIAAGLLLIGNPAIVEYAQSVDMPSLPWRLGFGLGVLPAFLIIWIRASVREPENWKAARARAETMPGEKMGVIRDLFGPGLLRSTVIGVSLATVGLATFWGTHIYGKDRLLHAVEAQYETQAADSNVEEAAADELDRSVLLKRWEMLGMLLVTTGGGIGMLCFGPICQRMGRRRAFVVFHVLGLAASVVLFQFISGVLIIACFLPIFGFFTLGMHAGYAIYFPELFPTRLRGTGAGFCFNGGRLLAAPVLFLNGWLNSTMSYTVEQSATLLSGLFLLGLVALIAAPETKGEDLPA